jgi:hypothetical protein
MEHQFGSPREMVDSELSSADDLAGAPALVLPDATADSFKSPSLAQRSGINRQHIFYRMLYVFSFESAIIAHLFLC